MESIGNVEKDMTGVPAKISSDAQPRLGEVDVLEIAHTLVDCDKLFIMLNQEVNSPEVTIALIGSLYYRYINIWVTDF
jgi:hypothetical protein